MRLQKSVGRMWSSLGLNTKASLNYQRQACVQRTMENASPACDPWDLSSEMPSWVRRQPTS